MKRNACLNSARAMGAVVLLFAAPAGTDARAGENEWLVPLAPGHVIGGPAGGSVNSFVPRVGPATSSPGSQIRNASSSRPSSGPEPLTQGVSEAPSLAPAGKEKSSAQRAKAHSVRIDPVTRAAETGTMENRNAAASCWCGGSLNHGPTTKV